MKNQEPILVRARQAMGQVWRRFPEGMVCLVGLVVALIVGIAIDEWALFQGSIIWLIVRLFGWGMIVGVNWRLKREAGFFDKKQSWIWGILATILGVAIVYGLGVGLFNLIAAAQSSHANMAWWASIGNYWQAGLTLILLLGWLIIPNLDRRKKGKEQIEAKSKNSSRLLLYLLQQGVLSGLFGGVINVGLMIALALIGWLFNLDWWEVQPYIITIVMVGFTMTYFLATFPRREMDWGKWEIPKIWKVLLFYIAAPLMLLYDLIIYVYLIFAAGQRVWPEGGVVNLILWFGMLAVLLIFLVGIWARDAEKMKGKWQEKLIKIFGWSLVPLAVVAAIGIGIRIWDQGWTMNRWLVVIGLIWVVSGVIILTFGWQKKRAKLWGWSILFLAAGMVGGPLVTQLSQRSRSGADWLQAERESRMIEYGIDEEDDAELSFSYSDKSRYRGGIEEPIEISEYDLLLVPMERSSEIEVSNSSESGRVVTYQWLGQTEEIDEMEKEVGVTAGEVGRLIIKINEQIVYDFDMKTYIAELNEKCDQEAAAADQISKYGYGCEGWKEIGKGGLDETALVLHHEENGIIIDYRLSDWAGYYNRETSKTTLRELGSLALVKFEAK